MTDDEFNQLVSPDDFVVNLNDKATAVTLGRILGIDRTALYSREAKGILPNNFTSRTYIENIRHLVAFKDKRQSVKEELDGENGSSSKSANTKLALAKTYQILRDMQIKEGMYLDKNLTLGLIIPFLQLIKEDLYELALELPEIEDRINSFFQHLYDIGESLGNQIYQEQKEFILEKLELSSFDELN